MAVALGMAAVGTARRANAATKAGYHALITRTDSGHPFPNDTLHSHKIFQHRVGCIHTPSSLLQLSHHHIIPHTPASLFLSPSSSSESTAINKTSGSKSTICLAWSIRWVYNQNRICPPSTTISVPLIYVPASLASSTTVPVSSLGLPIRPLGFRSAQICLCFMMPSPSFRIVSM